MTNSAGSDGRKGGLFVITAIPCAGRLAAALLSPSGQGWAPSLSQVAKESTLLAGQAPSQGIEPSSRRARMASPWAATSVADHRSKALLIEVRSFSRNSGLMSRSKLRVASGMGVTPVIVDGS